MHIKPAEEYIYDLFNLWKEAFGDEEAYIKLFFETVYKENVTVFADFDNGKIVSAFYLMRSFIRDKNAVYDGYYLYAAATLKEYRGKGIMGKLITEAQNYVSAEGKSFISLVPGEEYLYSYYKKFGFSSVMYRRKDIIECDGENGTYERYISFDEYFKKRDCVLKIKAHCFFQKVYSYAAACYEYLGLKALGGDDFLLVVDTKNNCVKELLTNSFDELSVYDKMKNILPEGRYTVYSPFGKEKEPYGMVWFADEKIREEIYMNIALD